MKSNISKWLKSRLEVVFRNKRDFREILIFQFSNLTLISFIFLLISFVFIVSFSLSTTLLSMWFDPRYAQKKSNEELVALSNSIDSLINESKIKDQYIENITAILSGKENNTLDYNKNDYLNSPQNTQSSYDAIDSFFRKQFESNLLNDELLSPTNYNQDLLLMSPVSSGIISSSYDPNKNHFGIDFVCKYEEPIKSTYDGTILFSSWTRDTGYVVSIIHPNNLISVYKHNSKVFVDVGQSVKTGDVIAIIGNTGNLSSGPHLHFELWLDGKSVNPSEFISL